MPLPAREPIKRPLLREEAYRRLRDAIVEGALEPGERLRDVELAAWLGLSRTPIREALGRLEEDGLIESQPGRWTRVTGLDRREARDAFAVVAALHELAARLGTPRLSPREIADLRAANERFAAALAEADVDEAIAADGAFHHVLLVAAANTAILSTLERLMPRVRRLERLRFASLAGRESVSQHERIAAACEARDTKSAARETRDNWLSLGALIDLSFPNPSGSPKP